MLKYITKQKKIIKNKMLLYKVVGFLIFVINWWLLGESFFNYYTGIYRVSCGIPIHFWLRTNFIAIGTLMALSYKNFRKKISNKDYIRKPIPNDPVYVQCRALLGMFLISWLIYG